LIEMRIRPLWGLLCVIGLPAAAMAAASTSTPPAPAPLRSPHAPMQLPPRGSHPAPRAAAAKPQAFTMPRSPGAKPKALAMPRAPGAKPQAFTMPRAAPAPSGKLPRPVKPTLPGVPSQVAGPRRGAPAGIGGPEPYDAKKGAVLQGTGMHPAP
jgi:hypothetical protein